MRIIVHSKERNLWIPVPMSLAGIAVLLIPNSAVSKIRKSLPPPWQELVTKAFLRKLYRECRIALKQYHGLEIVRVESADGELVSIRL